MTSKNPHSTGRRDVEEHSIERELKVLSQSVVACLQNREYLDRTLGPMRAAQLRGVPVQDDLETMFDRFEPMVKVAVLDFQGKLEKGLAAAVELDLLPEEAEKAFISWWAGTQWVVQGIEPYLETKFYSPHSAWTRTTLGFNSGNTVPIVEYGIENGVDELLRMHVPAPLFLRENADNVRKIIEAWVEGIESNSTPLDQSDADQLSEVREDLRKALDTLDRIPPDEQLPITTDEPDGDRGLSSENDDILEEIYQSEGSDGSDMWLRGFD